MVTVAPVAVVTTDGLLNMTPFVAARSIVAPATEAFPLVSAKTVNVTKVVPSAFKAVALELILIAATSAFAFGTVGTIGVVGTVGVVGVGVGVIPLPVLVVPALPPPPPQPAKAKASTPADKYFKNFISIFQRLPKLNSNLLYLPCRSPVRNHFRRDEHQHFLFS